MGTERRLSQRVQELKPSPTRDLDARVNEMIRRDHTVYKLNGGEPDFTTPSHILSAIQKATQRGETHYTAIEGILELREAAAVKLSRDNGLSYSPSEILFSTGAKQALFNTFEALCDPGDEVLVPVPTWSTYIEQAKLAQAMPVLAPLQEPFQLTAADIEPYVTDATRILVLNSPSNPAGAVVSRKNLEDIAQLAIQRDFWVITDEIYEHLVYESEHISIASLGEDIKERTLIVNGLSKSDAMTGLRVGFVAGPEDIIRGIKNFQGQVTSNITSIVQRGAIEAFLGDSSEREKMREEFKKRRDFGVERLRQIDRLNFTIPHGAFYIFVSLENVLREGQSSLDWCEELLKKESVAVVPGEAFEFPGWFRMSIAVDEYTLGRGLEGIEDFV